LRVEMLSNTSSEALRAALPDIEVSDSELLRHMSFTFAVESISRVCSHQLVRHRVASFSQQSQRYIPIRRLREQIVVPPTVDGEAEDEYFSTVEAASESYEALVASGVSREDARFVLPNAMETSLLLTIDGASLLHFFGLRLFKGAGPYCYQLGHCPEGRFSCDRMQEVAEKYSKETLG
jgi:thymidylate synthase (FAD)